MATLVTKKVNFVLSRRMIERAVLCLKILFVLLSLLIFAFVVRAVIISVLNGKSAVSDLEADITKVLSTEQAVQLFSAANTNISVIADNNIFRSRNTQPIVTPVVKNTPAPATIPLELVGTDISAGQPPYAIIEDKKRQLQEVFIPGDTVFGEATLKEVYLNRVVIERNGQLETLELDLSSMEDGGASAPKEGVASVGVDEYIVAEAELDKALENLPLLLTEARAVPYFKQGQSVGLRLFAIKQGSLFEKVGLKNGDILKSINGTSLGDVSQALKLFETLKQQRSLSVNLERNNEEKQFRYQVK